MTPRPSIIGRLAASRWFGEPRLRRPIVAILFVVLGLLVLFPQKYRAVATIAPTDPASLGLGGALGQLGAANSVFGQQAAVEIGLRVARSIEVRQIVIRNLNLMEGHGFRNEIAANRWLLRNVDIRALRGGLIQIEVLNRNSTYGLSLVAAYSDATRTRLGEINRIQTAYKRAVLSRLAGQASDRLADAQAAYDAFRRQTRYTEPGEALNSIGKRVPELQDQLKSMEVDLQAARAFATDRNMAVRQILAQMDALRSQLREAEDLDASAPNSFNRVVTQSTQVQKLLRELNIARALYDGYQRYLQGTAVEDITATGNVRVIEPPDIDPSRQINTLPAALLVTVILIWLAIEFYQLRPPIGVYPHSDGYISA